MNISYLNTLLLALILGVVLKLAFFPQARDYGSLEFVTACVNEAVRSHRERRAQLIPLKGEPRPVIEPTEDEMQAMHDDCTIHYWAVVK